MSKLNRILQNLPRGTVATQAWLNRQGVYRQLTASYLASGWLERIGPGAFVRTGDTADWSGGLYSLQSQLHLPVHVGGLTALSLKGFAHYLALGPAANLFVFAPGPVRLPAWFVRHDWHARVRLHCINLFQGPNAVGFTTIARGEYAIRASAPERAILEVIHLATTNDAIEHAVELTGGLTTLRPEIVQQLLQACRSVKVKRTFLWASARAGHRWLERLNQEEFDLGSGKRVVFRGGRLDRTYQITVPERETDRGG